jgi:hypothetical protein
MTKKSKTTGIKSNIWWCDVHRPRVMRDLVEYREGYLEGVSHYVCTSTPDYYCWMKNTVVSSKLISALSGAIR